MKLLLLVALLVSLALALDGLDPRQARGGKRARKRTSRPRLVKGEVRATAAARRPANAPARYRVDVDRPTRKRSKSVLTRLPAELVDADVGLVRRRDAWVEGARVAAALRRQVSANDFYECQASVRPPLPLPFPRGCAGQAAPRGPFDCSRSGWTGWAWERATPGAPAGRHRTRHESR